MRGQGLTKGFAFQGMPERQIQAGFGQRQAERGNGDAPAFECLQKRPKARALLAQEMVTRYADVLKNLFPRINRMPAYFFIPLANRIAGCIFGNNQRAVLFFAVVAAAVRGKRHQAVTQRRPRVGDKALGAVHHPVIALKTGRGHDVSGIRAGLGFGQTEGPEVFPFGQRGQPFFLLFFRTKVQIRQRADGQMGLEGGGYRLIDLAQLLNRHDHAHGTGVRAPVLLGDEQPHQL